jgi:hypothetical protein
MNVLANYNEEKEEKLTDFYVVWTLRPLLDTSLLGRQQPVYRFQTFGLFILSN